MAIYKLYIDVLFAVSTELENDIEIEVFGHQQFELVGSQLQMSDTITLEAATASEAINKAHTLVNEQYASTNNIGYYTHEGTYGYLDVQWQATHIHFANEMDEEYEDELEDINSEYYSLIA